MEKYRSVDMATKVKTEAALAAQAKFPPVTTLQSTVPVIPSGWVKVLIKMYRGAKNVTVVMSATARFIRR